MTKCGKCPYCFPGEDGFICIYPEKKPDEEELYPTLDSADCPFEIEE